MLGQGGGGREDLVRTAEALSDALRQLKSATGLAHGRGGTGSEKRGGGRGERGGRGRRYGPGGGGERYGPGGGGERYGPGGGGERYGPGGGGERYGPGGGGERYGPGGGGERYGPGGGGERYGPGGGGERYGPGGGCESYGPGGWGEMPGGRGWRGRQRAGSWGTGRGHNRGWKTKDNSGEEQGEQHYSYHNKWRTQDSHHKWRDYGTDHPDTPRSPRENQRGHWKHWGNREQEGRREHQGDRGQVEPGLLVKTLAAQPTFSVSLLQLMEEEQMFPADVRATAALHAQVFCLQGEEIKLQPQLDICAEHCGPQGCQNRHTCTNLHICPKLALDRCEDGPDCVLGHRWHTDHNLSVLKPLFLDQLRYKTLCELLQMLCADEGDCEGQNLVPLTVCAAYNKAECSLAECPELHVCLSFVTGLTRCSHDDCQLNHSILNASCRQMLQLHGISTNESPRDIVAALLHANPKMAEQHQDQKAKKNPPKSSEVPLNTHKESNRKESKQSNRSEKIELDKESDSDPSSETESKDSVSSDDVHDDSQTREKSRNNNTDSSSEKVTSKKGKSSSKKGEEDANSASEDDYESCDESQGTTEPGKKKLNKNSKVKGRKTESGGGAPPAAQRRTLWAHYLLGDVTMPEICYHSVEDVCKLEGSGCPRLHATQHFHWQVRQQPGRWMNLRHDQVICLERGFCDPEQDEVDLPRLDPASLDMSVSGLLMLLGRDVWHANFPDTASFTAFTLTNSSKTVTLELRRLCTEVQSGQSTTPTLNAWYFLDKNNKWVKYGKVDTVGETNLVSSATSDDIEKHCQQNPSLPLSFKNSQFTYTLDLQTMKQTNLNTKVNRAVRRRPEPHLPDEQKATEGSVQTASSDLPSHWDVMQAEERLRMVTLAPTSKEYQTAVGLLAGRVSSSNVVKVERIQNPFLWRALQNKIKELTTIYSDSSKVDVRQLFHGTSHNVIASICAENLDWRLHGSASGQSYGRGTYFAIDANYSYGYCRADASGFKYMFVVKVAVGSMTPGNSSMVRPPSNPATSQPFDSTVDNASNPSIIVKYDKQEYYPEYVITLT